jgi:hypothetical protein
VTQRLFNVPDSLEGGAFLVGLRLRQNYRGIVVVDVELGVVQTKVTVNWVDEAGSGW